MMQAPQKTLLHREHILIIDAQNQCHLVKLIKQTRMLLLSGFKLSVKEKRCIS